MGWRSSEFIRRGDCTSAVIDILQNYTPELPDYVRIGRNLVGYSPSDTWVEVVQASNIVKYPKISRTRIDVDVRSGHRDQYVVAKDVAEICESSIFRQAGLYRGFGLFIALVRLEQGITDVPERQQNVSRYLLSLRLTTVPWGDQPSTPS